MPRSTETPIAVLHAPLANAGPSPHAQGLGRSGWGALGCTCCAWAFLGRRLGSRPASCQVGAARDVGAAAILAVALLVDFEVLVVVVVAVAAAAAAAVAPPRSHGAGAGSPRDSTSSRRRVLITPLRDAICRCSKAIIACSAVGGEGKAGRAHRPPYAPWNGSGCVPPAHGWLRAECREERSQRRAYGRKYRGAL